MVNTVVQAFRLITAFCWNILTYKCIADTYSLWNVFQGVFAIWFFKIIITRGVLGWTGKANGGTTYGRSIKRYESQVNRKDVN